MIREARANDVQAIADVAEQRRVDYEGAQPQFWRRAANAVDVHGPWLATMVADPDVVSIVATSEDGTLTGYAFGTVVPAPPVYEPGGPTGFIDDFAVVDPERWPDVGVQLLAEARQRLARQGVAQIVVVCGHHDQRKRAALAQAGLAVVSQWYMQHVDRAEV